MTKYLTSSINPTSGNENKLMHKGSEGKFMRIVETDCDVLLVHEAQECIGILVSFWFGWFFVVFVGGLFWSVMNRDYLTELKWSLLDLVAQSKNL